VQCNKGLFIHAVVTGKPASPVLSAKLEYLFIAAASEVGTVWAGLIINYRLGGN
jgi:hypothetical protein